MSKRAWQRRREAVAAQKTASSGGGGGGGTPRVAGALQQLFELAGRCISSNGFIRLLKCYLFA
jgi:hypothetical protein